MAESSRLTVDELLSLFHHSVDDSRWISMADSMEYLAVVMYVVARNQKELEGG